ncbi:unnamed protein product [Ectocarpus sp. CCAP 1310/34]|nr:unnamed protein product [Ectocarpus sp. CCAP 1310/34]
MAFAFVFRGVEASDAFSEHLLGVERSVEFLLSPRLGQAYQHLKEHGSNLPLVGRAVFLPSVEAAEGVTRFFLVVVQAPLPSAESVANVAEVHEVSMDVGKRGLRVAFRELYFYMDLIDQQMTRTMTRAQWGILGYGPYADLPLKRREEVVDRACEKYLSLEHPIQRYEFLAHIRWHNAALHDDLVQTGLLRARANAIQGGEHIRTLGSFFVPSSPPLVTSVRLIVMPASAGDEDAQGTGSSEPTASAANTTSAGDLPATTAAASSPSPSPSPFAGDAWLDADAVWRRQGATTTSCKSSRVTPEDKGDSKRDGDKRASSSLPCRYYLEGVVTGDVSESRVGWFRRSGGAWTSLPAGEGDGGGPWEAFSAREGSKVGRIKRCGGTWSMSKHINGVHSAEVVARGTPTTARPSWTARSRPNHILENLPEVDSYGVQGHE